MKLKLEQRHFRSINVSHVHIKKCCGGLRRRRNSPAKGAQLLTNPPKGHLITENR